jgi:hypothetical protein
VRTIVAGEQYGQGRLQEAIVFGRTSLTLKVDNADTVWKEWKSRSCNANIRSGQQQKNGQEAKCQTRELLLKNEAHYGWTAKCLELSTPEVGSCIS